MKMLKLLIVEDERWEREGLAGFLDWASLGIETAGLACDGIEGVERARLIRPDIIVTDIKMPGLDGLKMSGRIKEFLPEVKIIILTGYDDFKFAREAIAISANAYVLKPVEQDEMLAAVKKVVEECNREAAKREEENSMKARLMENANRAKNKLLLDFMKGRLAPVAGGLPEIPGLVPGAAAYAIAAAGLPPHRAKAQCVSNIPGLAEDIARAVEEAPARAKYKAVPDESDGVILICLQLEERAADTRSPAIAGPLQGLLAKCAAGAVMGVGKPVSEIREIPLSYLQAVEAMSYGIFREACGIVHYQELEDFNRGYEKTGDFLTKGYYFNRQLLHSVRSADEERAYALLDEMFGMIYENRWTEKKVVANYLYGLVNETSLLLYNLKLCPGGGRDYELAGEQLLKAPDLGTMKELIYDFFEGILGAVIEKKNFKDEYIAKKVLRLIEERYMTDISLKTIAAEIFLSPNYLGSIFKRYTGKPFSDYLCRYRMEKAKELLHSPKNRVSRVARAVGISSTSYFCTLFKNTFGVAPGEYQETVIRDV